MLTNKETGIYIHIPFCVKKCNYCDFLSSKCSEKIVNKYVNALLNEIMLYSNKQRLIKTIYIGGGTPSILDDKHIKKIIDTVTCNYNIDDNVEITMEVNPGTVDYNKLKKIKETGINRLSFGMQSVNNEELKILGRIHSFEEFEENYNNARKVGFDNINIDIMSAIPNQTMDSYKTTLDKVVKLCPEHISSYSLIIEEGTVFYKIKDTLKLPSESLEREMYYYTNDYLTKNGYNRYEISNYSKNGYESKHNSSYWTGRDYYGFGLGASSYIDSNRYNNQEDINIYIDILDYNSYELLNLSKDSNKEKNNKKDMLKNNVEYIDEDEKIKEFIILGLRMIKGINKTEFKNRFNRDINSIYGDIINKYTKLNLLEESLDFLRLTEAGIDVSNVIMVEFM